MQFWQTCASTLSARGTPVSWWNLQCYSGGGVNVDELPTWISAAGGAANVVPGLAVCGSECDGLCPTPMSAQFGKWSSLGIRGGVIVNFVNREAIVMELLESHLADGCKARSIRSSRSYGRASSRSTRRRVKGSLGRRKPAAASHRRLTSNPELHSSKPELYASKPELHSSKPEL